MRSREDCAMRAISRNLDFDEAVRISFSVKSGTEGEPVARECPFPWAGAVTKIASAHPVLEIRGSCHMIARHDIELLRPTTEMNIPASHERTVHIGGDK